jgi:outer membrane receptor for ferrienterochelin and colicins
MHTSFVTRRTALSLACCLMLYAGEALAADNSDEDDLAAVYGDQASVSIATGGKQSLSRAPAVASVITAQNSAAMGATTLGQVMESVPGVHVSKLSIGLGTIFGFRGVHTFYNSQVLVLINGIPWTEVYAANRGIPDQLVYVENIARIEVIRGSGSALYGADAFSGVINVITKNANDFKGTEAGARFGSFNTREAWLLHSGTLGPFATAFYARSGRSDGQDSWVAKDFQTTLDQVFGTRASLAPGPVNAFSAGSDLAADVATGYWRARAHYQHREKGQGLGLADNLDPYSRYVSQRSGVDLSYQNEQFAQDWEVSGVLAYQHYKLLRADPGYLLFPPGAFGGAFPNGVYGIPARSERHTDLNLSALYTGLEGHKVRVGLGGRNEDLYETSELKNFNFVVVPGVGPVLAPLPGLVDATGNPAMVYMLPHQRQLGYAYAQDEWSLTKDLTLTAGVRHDNYSDFGGTTNPRAALVWDADYNLVVKLIHNRAFRAPSFSEQYLINNPVALGNPAIRPETITSNEVVFSWTATPQLKTNLSLFHYRMRDLLKQVPNPDPVTGTTAQNIGSQTGRGFEWDGVWDASRNLRVSANLSVQQSTDDANGQDAGLAPRQHVYIRTDWRFAPDWQLSGVVNHVADRRRELGDPRPPVADYTTVDLALRRERVLGNGDLRLVIQNLLDREAREPTFAPGNSPHDIPLPGRSVYLQLSYKI